MPLVRPSALLSKDTLVAVTNSSVPSDPDPIVFFRVNNQTDNSGMAMGDHLAVKNHQMQAYSQPILLDYIDERNHGYIVKGLGLESSTEFKFTSWMSDIDFNTWSYDPNPQNLSEAPHKFPQSGFSATAIPKKPIDGKDSIIYFFGGFNKESSEFKLTNGLLSYNLNKREWTDLSFTSDSLNIPTLAYHTAIAVDNRYLVIMGGMSSKSNSTYQSLNKLLVFDSKEARWLPLSPKWNSQCSQKPIVGHTAVEFRGKVIVYGGIDSINSSSQPYSDFCVLNPSTWEWSDERLLDSAGNNYSIGIAWHASIVTNNHMIVLYGSSQNPSSPIMTIDLNSNQVTEAIIFKGSFNLNDSTENKPNVGLIAGVWTLAAVLICFFILVFYYCIIKKRIKRRPTPTNYGQDKNKRLFSSFRKNSNTGEEFKQGEMAIWSDSLRTINSHMTLKNPEFGKDNEKGEEGDTKNRERLSKFFLDGDTIDEDLLKHDEPKFIELEIGYNTLNKSTSIDSTNVDQTASDKTFINDSESGAQVSKLGETGIQDTLIDYEMKLI